MISIYNCPSNSYQIFCKLGYNSENSVFFLTVDYYFVFETVYSMCTDRDASISNTKIVLI